MYIHMDYTIRWDPEKSERLKATRGASFEDLLGSELVAIRPHVTRPNQTVFYFHFQDYIWLVPAVIREKEAFFKTLHRSRKHMRLWKRGKWP